jgi:hypothetical protein
MDGRSLPFYPDFDGVWYISICVRRCLLTWCSTLPQEEIEGGVRLAPVESQWDGYGEAS